MRFEASKLAALGLAFCAAPAVSAEAPAAAPPSAASPTPAPAWKQIYQSRQSTYYLSADGAAGQGTVRVASLIQFRIPQVMDGAQVWSIVTRMNLDCAGRRMVTLDNTSYAAKMGAGPVVSSENPADVWHAPQPGTLGELILRQVCPGSGAAAPAP